MDLPDVDCVRITSTCVENTKTGWLPEDNIEDHLHMRGEYDELNLRLDCYVGSPPHAWRILKSLSGQINQARITSTCVENTRTLLSSTHLIKDHLHMRGEYLSTLAAVHDTSGSPPHAWRIPTFIN